MAKYTLAELIYLTYLRAKHGAIKIIDSVRPKIFLRRNLTEYTPKEFFGMEIDEVLEILGVRRGKVKITY